MAKKDKPNVDAAKVLGAAARDLVGTDSGERAVHLLNQVLNSVRSVAASDSDRNAAMLAVADMFAEMRPRDETERMLIAQMISIHEATMECFRRAMLPEQSSEGRDMNLKHAERLTAIYARQLEALDKHRGKGKQKITVEHVNVHAGGQAIVGDVNAAKADAPPAAAELQRAPVLTDDSAASADGEKLREALSAKKAPATKRDRN